MLASTYGWTHQDILKLTARQFFLYLHQIFMLSSIKQLKMFEANLLPYMGDFDRKQVIEGYRQMIVPVETNKKEVEESWDLLRKR